MHYIRFLTTAFVIGLASACASMPTSIPTAANPTVMSTAIPTVTTLPTLAQAASKSTEMAVAPTSTQVPATATVPIRHPIPANFPLATFTMTDGDGRWTASFGADGTFQTTLKGGVAARGTFDVAEDRLTLHDISGSKSCKAAQGDGTYKWSFDGTVFKLEGVSDNCVPRAATLSSSVWTIER